MCKPRTLRRAAACLCLHALVAARASGAAAPPSRDFAVPAPSSELESLRQQLAEQQKQIDLLRREIDEQKRALETIVRLVAAGDSAQIPAQVPQDNRVASLSPTGLFPVRAAAAPSPARTEPAQPQGAAAPLSFGIGAAQITPFGWIDLTAYIRQGNVGSGLGTNFAAVPFSSSVNGNLVEDRLTAQGTRMGFRVDVPIRGAQVLGYLETDFNGLSPGNAAVTSHANGLRMRLGWVKVAYRRFEILGGQSWSLLAPNRRGLSPLPADVFTGMTIDPNHHIGLPWGRIPQFRLIYRPAAAVTVGLSLENPEQYIGGSAGAGISILPSQLAPSYAGQLSNGGTTLAAPNPIPDIIAKAAFDRTAAGRPLHFEVAGLVRKFKVYNPLTDFAHGAAGGGGSANLSLEPVKNFRVLVNTSCTDGGGRYLFGLGPDLIIRGDGSISLVRAYSTIDGFEVQAGQQSSVYGYYGGVYFQKNTAIDPANGKLVGYGFSGSPSSHNRALQQITLGLSHTFWRRPELGGLQLNAQYSYLLRHPWDMPAGQPRSARANVLYLNLRYLLPGAPPTPAK